MQFKRPSIDAARTTFAVFVLALAAGCGGRGVNGPQNPSASPITVSLADSILVLPQDGTAVATAISITSTSETALVAVSNLPSGVQQAYAASNTNPSGLLTFVANSSSLAGSFTPTITVMSAGQTATAQVTLVIAPVVKVSNKVDTTLGVKGKFQQFLSTSFQIAEWTGDAFGTGATATAREAMLTNLAPQHIRLQAISQAIPMKANTGASSDWNFSLLDQIVQPVLASADRSPEFQIAVAPAWMCDSVGHLDVVNHANDFADYAANLVRYYNKGGFDAGGVHFQSPSGHAITWWGIFNEYNINGLRADEYVTLYNSAVPAMLAVDPTIKLVAIELSDFGLGSGLAGDPMQSLPTFLAPAGSGGVKAEVDALATHFYGTCNQSDADATVFGAVPHFVENVNYFYNQLQLRADLAKVPVWVTENNVNADFSNNGKSQCNPTQNFVLDQRGTSAFFVAWRAYAFSQLGKAGNRALYQWSYSGDRQYAEVDASGNPYISYWADRTLATLYPSTVASPGPDILLATSTDTTSIETLATRSSDGVIRVMVVNRAVHSPADNNGNGDPRTVIVDTSAFGTFTAASVLTVDANTNLATGPAGKGVSPSARIAVTLNGYGVAFLSLMP